MSDPSLPLPFATEVIHFNFKVISTQWYRQHYHLTIDIVTGFKIQGQYPTPGGTPGKPSANSQQDPTPPTPADSTDKRAAPSQTGVWPLTPTQFQDTNQFQASGRQILPSDQALAPPADLYQSQDANQFQLSDQPLILPPTADLH
jgi:hypothetical protein